MEMKPKYNHQQNVKQANKIFKQVDFDALGASIAALMTTSSSAYGSDCLMCTGIVKSFLERKGLSPEWVIGEVAWRVDGKDDGAVVSHTVNTLPSTVHIPEVEGVKAGIFHAWLKLTPVWYLDITTFQLAKKMEILDMHDNRATPVSWRPEFLIFKESDISTFKEVQQSYDSGVFWYKKGAAFVSDPDTVTQRQEALIDSEDVDMLEFMYSQCIKGNEMAVIGPSGSYKMKSNKAV